VHCCGDTFFRWYPDEIAKLAARQSVSNIDAKPLGYVFLRRAVSGLRMVA